MSDDEGVVDELEDEASAGRNAGNAVAARCPDEALASEVSCLRRKDVGRVILITVPRFSIISVVDDTSGP